MLSPLLKYLFGGHPQRLEVIELDNSKKISEFNNMVKNREIRTPLSAK